ncbi:glycosyltransferase [Lysobacter sp. Root667]|uniref:glycosyltransferase n=1 Tax=Lysobacter sp. Root667 TaxID=1736581 RepID=UPI0031B6282B
MIRGATHRYADGVGLAREAERVAGTAVEFLPSSRIRSGRRIRPLNDAPPYRLMFLGRWHENKGVDLLLQALGMLDEETWSRIGAVHIAGGGPLEERVRTGCECLVAQGRPVRLSGFLGRIEAEHMLAEADYLLLPSRVESIPLVFSDALKFGLPIIANPVGDLPDLLTPAEGFIAEAATAEAFARSISIAMHASASSYAPAITELARTFSLPDVAARLETTFRSPDAT